ncbi:FMN reductase [Sphingorhabdus lutea]|uniref:FMN reductase n=1 Tax=Sphingorhabdus lutea TaxID=1913578 RepID=A0A1L3J994_9SPHN|nr:NAD(P)H-dependent oxidoreductase [Sphingorhabdus lutea]APG61688.1 FMN reductase [Sphingorhabdus lutea]
MTIKIVAIGGTVNPNSSTEQALVFTANVARDMGCEISVFGGEYLMALPHYGGPDSDLDRGKEMAEAVRAAHGVILASPGYHGSISGLVKNGLDYLELLSKDDRVYLDGRAVGMIATAFGHQAAMSSLQSLRTITHALRGWPTPMGAAIKTSHGLFTPDGGCSDEIIAAQLTLVGQQVAEGARKLSKL